MQSLWDVDMSWRKAVRGWRWWWGGAGREAGCAGGFLTPLCDPAHDGRVWTESAARAKTAWLLTSPFLTSRGGVWGFCLCCGDRAHILSTVSISDARLSGSLFAAIPGGWFSRGRGQMASLNLEDPGGPSQKAGGLGSRCLGGGFCSPCSWVLALSPEAPACP